MMTTPLRQFRAGETVTLKCLEGRPVRATIERVGPWDGPWTEVDLLFKNNAYNDFDTNSPCRGRRRLYAAVLCKAVVE